MTIDAGTARPARFTSEVRLLLTAVQYFTRIPVPAWVGHGQEQLNGAARYFPAVGLIVGLIAALTFWICSLLLPSPLPAILSTAATMLLTGAFHEDGLADTFDGLGGSAARERALEIMKDSRLGTFGVAALVIALSTKIAALGAMPLQLALCALIAAHAFSRACAALLLFTGSYAGKIEQSRAKPMAQHMERGEFAFAAVVGTLPVILCGVPAIAGFVAALLVLYVLARWFTKRLGGFTGDTLGAAQQLTEIAFYLAVLAAWKYS
jgi:adenosylcobinamide-GDP ribazoletransferase